MYFLVVLNKIPFLQDNKNETIEIIGEDYLNSLPGDPIEKRNISGGGASYQIEGSFVEKLEKKNELLTGQFVIKGDVLEREIKVFLGYINGTVAYGTYEDTFDSESKWKLISSDLVTELIGPGEPVVIRYVLQPNANDDIKINKYMKSMEEVMDALIYDFQRKEFLLELPENFIITSSHIGVIK
jgi:hypothetical protein